jgi:hypothetical protein
VTFDVSSANNTGQWPLGPGKWVAFFMVNNSHDWLGSVLFEVE